MGVKELQPQHHRCKYLENIRYLNIFHRVFCCINYTIYTTMNYYVLKERIERAFRDLLRKNGHVYHIVKRLKTRQTSSGSSPMQSIISAQVTIGISSAGITPVYLRDNLFLKANLILTTFVYCL